MNYLIITFRFNVQVEVQSDTLLDWRSYTTQRPIQIVFLWDIGEVASMYVFSAFVASPLQIFRPSAELFGIASICESEIVMCEDYTHGPQVETLGFWECF